MIAHSWIYIHYQKKLLSQRLCNLEQFEFCLKVIFNLTKPWGNFKPKTEFVVLSQKIKVLGCSQNVQHCSPHDCRFQANQTRTKKSWA